MFFKRNFMILPFQAQATEKRKARTQRQQIFRWKLMSFRDFCIKTRIVMEKPGNQVKTAQISIRSAAQSVRSAREKSPTPSSPTARRRSEGLVFERSWRVCSVCPILIPFYHCLSLLPHSLGDHTWLSSAEFARVRSE